MWRVLTNAQRSGLFFTGAGLSNIGTWCQNVAAVLLVYQITGSTLHVALVSVAQFAPSFLFGLWAGVLADRYDRRIVLATCQTGGAIVSLVLAVLAINGSATFGATIACIGVLGLMQAVQTPSQLAFVPLLVAPDERELGLSLNATQYNLARAIGPVIATVLGSAWGLGSAFLFNAASYLAFLGVLGLIRPHPQAIPVTRPSVRGMLEALRASPVVIMLICLGLIAMGATDVVVTLGPARSTQLTDSSAWTGAFLSAFGAGAALSSVTLVPLLRRFRRVLTALLLVQGLCVAVFATTSSLWLAITASAIHGAAFIISMNRALSMVQAGVDALMVGRISAVWSVAVLGGRLIFASLDGGLVGGLGVGGTGLVVAGTVTLTAIIWWWWRRARYKRLNSRPHET